MDSADRLDLLFDEVSMDQRPGRESRNKPQSSKILEIRQAGGYEDINRLELMLRTSTEHVTGRVTGPLGSNSVGFHNFNLLLLKLK